MSPHYILYSARSLKCKIRALRLSSLFPCPALTTCTSLVLPSFRVAGRDLILHESEKAITLLWQKRCISPLQIANLRRRLDRDYRAGFRIVGRGGMALVPNRGVVGLQGLGLGLGLGLRVAA